MTAVSIAPQRSLASIWLQAVRAFAYPASLVPVFVGGMMALSFEGRVMWQLYPIIIICSILYHTGTNLISDYFDFKREVDKDYTFGGSGVLTGGLLTPKQIYAGGWVAFGIAIALGFILIAFRGMPMFYFGLAGLVGGYLYCGDPFGYKYVALGDILVFTLMGPLMVIGSYFALTGSFNINVFYVSIPVGCLVASILHANNTRDILHDSEAKVKTLANIIGHKASKLEYFILVLGAYASVIVMVSTKVISPWSLIVLFSLPPALKNLKTMAGSSGNKIEEIATLDVQSAQLHLLFGLLLTISLVAGALMG